MPVSSEPFYGGSLIQGVGSFHNTDLARLHKNRRRLSPVQRRIVDLASMKKYPTPDSLYNALYQATQHPHLTAELVPKPLQANPATFLIASEGPDTLRGLVDGHSDDPPPGGPPPGGGGPKGGRPPGGPPGGDDRPTPPASPASSAVQVDDDTPTTSSATQAPPKSDRRTQASGPPTGVSATQDPLTGESAAQTDDRPTTSSATQDPVTGSRETQVDEPVTDSNINRTRDRSATREVTGKRGRRDVDANAFPSDDTSPRKRPRLGEASSEEVPVRRGSSRVPPALRHRRHVNVRRYTQGVTLSPQQTAANYLTSLMHTSVNALPHIALVSGMLVHNGGHARLEAVVRGMTNTMPPWAVDALFQGFQGVSEGLAGPEQIVPRMESLQRMVRAFLSPDENAPNLGQLWSGIRGAMEREEEPEALQEISRLLREGGIVQETFNMIQSAGLPHRRSFIPSQEDMFNVAYVENVLQDRERVRRELPLALNHFLRVGHMAFENVAQSARVYGPHAYVFEDHERSLGRGIYNWTRRYYRAITGRESTPDDNEPAHGAGLEARRAYVRDSMTSVLGLAGTAFLARAALRYVNFGANLHYPPDDREFEEHYERFNERITREPGGLRMRTLPTSEERPAWTEDGEVHANIEQPPARDETFSNPRPRDRLVNQQAEPVDEHQMAEGEEHMQQLQDGHANDPQASRHRVVNEVLRPINERIRAFDRSPVVFRSLQQRLAARQDAMREAIDGGLNRLNHIAPNEWRMLRENLRMRRNEGQPAAAYDPRRPNAPFSMFTTGVLRRDDPDVNQDAPEALGGDSRMRAPGLGFQPGEGGWRGRTRNAGVGDPIIALTETGGNE